MAQVKRECEISDPEKSQEGPTEGVISSLEYTCMVMSRLRLIAASRCLLMWRVNSLVSPAFEQSVEVQGQGEEGTPRYLLPNQTAIRAERALPGWYCWPPPPSPPGALFLYGSFEIEEKRDIILQSSRIILTQVGSFGFASLTYRYPSLIHFLVTSLLYQRAILRRTTRHAACRHRRPSRIALDPDSSSAIWAALSIIGRPSRPRRLLESTFYIFQMHHFSTLDLRMAVPR